MSSDLETVRSVRKAWARQKDTEKVTLGPVCKHFDVLEAEITRLKKCLADGQQKLVEQADEIIRLQSEIRSIHRQHAKERPSW